MVDLRRLNILYLLHGFPTKTEKSDHMSNLHRVLIALPTLFGCATVASDLGLASGMGIAEVTVEHDEFENQAEYMLAVH